MLSCGVQLFKMEGRDKWNLGDSSGVSVFKKSEVRLFGDEAIAVGIGDHVDEEVIESLWLHRCFPLFAFN